MPLTIDSIIPGSLASEREIEPGDIILEINGEPISDFIDLQFHGADEHLLIKLRSPRGELKKISIFQDWQRPLGIEPKSHNCTTCINNCIFCFVDQMRDGFRKSLYIKDDDYRLSFVYGNFITLTNLTDIHIQRIIQQRLSPLYISVHTTNPELHKKMLRYKRDFNILDALNTFANGKIEMHTQLVIIPGWNDKDELLRSLKDLDAMGEQVLSIGVVPVGITKFRDNLDDINPVGAKEAKEILEIASKFQRTYCSDELYVLADEDIPDEDFYDGYPQLENGIGMIRLFLDNWNYEKDDFIDEILELDEKIVFVTGVSAENTLAKVVHDINIRSKDKARVKVIENDFFGSTVTVTGLLTARDIIAQLDLVDDEIPAISAGIFNDEELTLDGMHITEFVERLNKPIYLIDEEFADWELINP